MNLFFLPSPCGRNQLRRIHPGTYLVLNAFLALIPLSIHALTLDEVVANDPNGASLAEAYSGARFAARPVEAAPGQWQVQNPKHGLDARFTPQGLSMEVTLAGEERRTLITYWHTTGIGYGDDLTAVPEGVVAPGSGSENNRIEIRRAGVVEWFVNGAGGLEHGYTLPARPAGESEGRPLRVEMALEGDLEAEVTVDGRHVVLRDGGGTEVLRYEKLKVWDATGRELVARLSGGSRTLAVEVEDAEAVYPLTIDPIFAQQSYLKASNTGQDDTFGSSVAIDGDTAIVGAPGEDSDAGAAYVFVRSGTAWTEQAYLKASNPDGNDQFGGSVAISGDTAIVGARGEASSAMGIDGNEGDNSLPFAGAAYVFVRSGVTWTQQAYLKASNTAGDFDEFGTSVAISGDTAIVGAWKEDSNATGVGGNQNNTDAESAGAAYVFVRNVATWTQQAYLKASNAEAGDAFGVRVALAGDTALVGAYGEGSSATGVDGNQGNNGLVSAGASYVFFRNGVAWTQQAYLKSSSPGNGELFGISVSVSGDTALVGAGGDDSAAGSADVFIRSGATWTPQAYLQASNPGGGDRFGTSVAISGDTALVGAFSEDSNATGIDGDQSNNGAGGAGAAYYFRRSAATWTQQAYLKASNTAGNDSFGTSVAISGETILIGALFEDSNATGANGNGSDNTATDAGAAYVFVIAPAETTVSPPKKFRTSLVGKKSKAQTILITNSGGRDLTGLSVSLSGKGRRDFRLTPPALNTLAPRASTSFSVTFKPKAMGRRKAIATVTSSAAAKSVELSGKGK